MTIPKRNYRLRDRFMLTAACLATLSAGEAARAQDASADQKVESNDIIVTAQRRNERLEDVPMAVQVVSEQTLANAGIVAVRDLANVTTGFQQNQSGIVPQISLRGVTSLAAGSYENNVAVFVDGLYQTTSQIVNMDLPNVRDIQILKGPQGTLYGRNAMGGAILINTIEPGREWAGNLEATYGRFDDRRVRGYVAGPLTDRLGVSFAGAFRKTDGYYRIASRTTPGAFDGRGLGMEQESARAKVRYDLTDTLRATVGYNYLRASDPRGALFTPIENVNTNYLAPGRNTRPRGQGEYAGDVGILDYKQHETSLTLELDTGIGKLRSITGYADGRMNTEYDTGGTYEVTNYVSATTRDRTLQEAIDFSVDAIDKLDLTIGGNYYRIKSDYVPGRPQSVWVAPAGAPDPAVTPTPLSSYRRASETHFFRTKEAWAIFADATLHATDRLSVTLGGRYSKEKQDVYGYKRNYCTLTAGCPGGVAVGELLAQNFLANSTLINPATSGMPYSIAGSPATATSPAIPGSAKSSNYSKFTPRASIRYELAPRTNVYLSYSQGFRGGEWNAVVPSDDPSKWRDAKQETISAFELGLKSGGSRYHFDVSGFHYNYKDLQVSSTAFVNGAALITLQNAPSAKIYGIDANFDYELSERFKVRAGATWLHARFGDRFVYNATGVNPTAVGFNVNADVLRTFVNVPQINQNLSGMDMPRAPDFSGFVGFDYEIPDGDGGLMISGNVKYTSSYIVTSPAVWGGDPTYLANLAIDPNYLPDNTKLFTQNGAAGAAYVDRANEQRGRQSGYALINASVTWTDPGGRYYARLWGANLTDKVYQVHYSPSTSTYAPIGEPRTFGVTLGARFGAR